MKTKNDYFNKKPNQLEMEIVPKNRQNSLIKKDN